MLGHAARLGTQLQNGQAGGIINEQGGAGQLAGRAGQLGKVALGQKALAHIAQVDPRARAQHAQDQRFGRHFQAEYADGQALLDRHVLGDVHRQRGLAHRRARGDDDHLAAVQPAGHFVEIHESRCQSR